MSIYTLNIRSNGRIEYNLNDIKQWVTDTSDPLLTAEVAALVQSLIDDLQAGGFTEIHMETNDTRSFVQKVAIGRAEDGGHPNDYQLFSTMKEWGAVLYDEYDQHDEWG